MYELWLGVDGISELEGWLAHGIDCSDGGLAGILKFAILLASKPVGHPTRCCLSIQPQSCSLITCTSCVVFFHLMTAKMIGFREKSHVS
jgi:hypothetical protein